jgi:hypothetical protein
MMILHNKKNKSHMLKSNIDNPILNKMPNYFGMTTTITLSLNQKKKNLKIPNYLVDLLCII